MTTAAAVIQVLDRYETALADVLRRVSGDGPAVLRAGAVAKACGTRAAAANGRLGTARTDLATAWAAPSGDAFRVSTDPVPGAITAAERLLDGMAGKMERLGLILDDTRTSVRRIRDQFAAYAATVRSQVAGAAVVPDAVLQHAMRTGDALLRAAEAAAQRLDDQLRDFAATVTTLIRDLDTAYAAVEAVPVPARPGR